MDRFPEGEVKVQIGFGKDWPNIRGKTLNEIAEMPDGLAMLPQFSRWLKAKGIHVWLSRAIDVYLAVPKVAQILEIVQQQEADRKSARKPTARDHAQQQRQVEYGR